MKMKIDTRAVDQLLQDSVELKQSLIDAAYKHFVAITPIGNPSTWKSKPPAGYQPGNARKSTKKNKDSVEADYAYAERLDKGWSKQAPDGMTGPTIEFLQLEVQNILKGK
jgi:hypothetical protein